MTAAVKLGCSEAAAEYPLFQQMETSFGAAETSLSCQEATLPRWASAHAISSKGRKPRRSIDRVFQHWVMGRLLFREFDTIGSPL
jgi:hypothetical protein